MLGLGRAELYQDWRHREFPAAVIETPPMHLARPRQLNATALTKLPQRLLRTILPFCVAVEHQCDDTSA